MRVHKGVFGAVAIAVLMALTGCSGADDSPSSAPGATEVVTVEPDSTTPPRATVGDPQRPATLTPPEGNWGAFGPFLRFGTSSVVTDVPRFYFPEVGEVEIDLGALLGEDVTQQEYTYAFDGEEPFLVALGRVRIPADGLTPEHFVDSLVSISATASPQIINQVDMEADSIGHNIAATSDSGFIALGTWDLTTNAAAGVVGVDLTTGESIWQVPGYFEGQSVNYVRVFESTGERSSEVSDCDVHSLIDLRTGETTWSLNEWAARVTVPTKSSDYTRCVRVEEDDLSGGYAAVRELGVEDNSGEWLDTWMLVNGVTGVATPVEFEPVAIDSRQPLAQLLQGFGFYGQAQPHHLSIAELTSGEMLFSVSEDDVKALSLSVEQLFDGILYVTTTDEHLAIDARTGEELGQWTVYPRADVGDYTWMSDDTLRLDWTYSGE